MYNYNTHKKHKVIPVDHASSEIKEDIASMNLKIEKKLKYYTSIVDDLNNKILEN